MALGAVLAALALLPLLAVGLELGAWAAGVQGWVGVLEQLTGPICHRDPARTLVLGGRPLPVCARCTGMYGAAAVSGVVGLALGGRKATIRASLGLGLGATALGLLAALLEYVDLVHTTNAVRLVLGALLGAAPVLVAGLGARVILDAARGISPRTPPPAE